ncbi:hypothetical protein [Salipiger bermudensis]|uniref:hypothetical protein n=1 Tax=Salipiger bermudensis TaxID=344736 RepID=UPI001A902A06|nr:hypothetical protein [Salipiger bermudensis]MBN9675069.1 hypothetical protein [Salipiger bermudensis]
MLVGTTKWVIAILAVVYFNTNRVGAESLTEIIGRIESSRSDLCSADPKLVHVLIKGMEARVRAGDDLSEISEGLAFLADEREWRSENIQKSLESLIAIGKMRPELKPTIADAQATARGELFHILSRDSSDIEKIEVDLENLAKVNASLASANEYYVAKIKLSLAETLTDFGVAEILKTEQIVPLKVNPPQTGSQAGANESIRAIDLLNRSIELYGELSTFYRRKFLEGEFFSRDIGMDLRYQMSLLRYISGDSDWVGDLKYLAKINSWNDMFNSFAPVGHVSVQYFISPALLPSPPGDIRDLGAGGCALSSQNATGRPDYVKRQFFNPIQLASYTCAELSSNSPFEDLTAIPALLSRFKNSDYRVVLGHFRGENVRFSYLSRAKIAELGDEVIRSIDISDILGERAEIPDYCESQLGSVSPRSTISAAREQVTGDKEGYIYIGEALNYIEARRLLDEVVKTPGLEEAYLIRPKI